MTPAPNGDELLTIGDIAKRVGVARAQVSSWAARGEMRPLAHVKLKYRLVGLYSLAAGERLARLYFERKASRAGK